MRRTKIKTDNVEQLMEIVRSLQRGEEPTRKYPGECGACVKDRRSDVR